VATSSFKTLRFKLIFFTTWFIWAELHAWVLNNFGFGWGVAITDSIVSNILLMGTCMLTNLILNYYIPQKRKYTYILSLCFVLSLIWLLLSRSILMGLENDIPEYSGFFSHSIPVRMAFTILIIGCMALISILWYTLEDKQAAEKRRAEVEKLSKEAELYKLRQQLQPHFLFNSLNSINALIGMKPQQARTMIQQLSDFLRGTLKKEDNQWISLDEELHHLQLYLDIEKVRFGHRLTAQINKQFDGEEVMIPAMLLQPIVENAIKFGLYDTTDDIVISITAEMQKPELKITVTNPFDPETARPGTGFGLKSVQRRLYLLFARNDLLQTTTFDHTFITTIKIPQHDQGDNNR
jgi:two-component system LytT family sensor kinase